MSIQNHPRDKEYTLSTFDAVTSSAKFTFSKANRFPDLKLQHHLVGYDLPSTIVAKTATFGIGSRNVFKGRKGKNNC